MVFTYKATLTGDKGEVWLKEIDYASYKSVVKSLYSESSDVFVQHLITLVNSILQHEVEDLNVIDLVIILLTARAVSVGPDIKLRVQCPETEKEFEYTIQIDDLVSKLNVKNINHTHTYKDVEVKCSVLKMGDLVHVNTTSNETQFTKIVSSIDKLYIKGIDKDFGSNNITDRTKIVESFSPQLTKEIRKALDTIEENLTNYKLVKASSPFTGNDILELPLTLDFEVLLEFITLLFKADLSNLYITEFNLLNRGNMTGDYLNNITPVEVQVFWSYLQQQIEKEEKEQEQGGTSQGGNPFESEIR